MLEIGNKTGELLKPSEIVNHLIDNYLDDAVKDLISKEELKKKRQCDPFSCIQQTTREGSKGYGLTGNP